MRRQEPDQDDGRGESARPARSAMTPSAARRRLGDDLRTARETAGLTLHDAAKRIQRSAPTLSRLENGKSAPRVVDVKALLDQYAKEAPAAVPNGAREHIVDLAEAARAEEWFTPFRDVISSDMTADDIQRYVEFESDATRIRAFQPELVPGLLQTRGYAEAVTSLFFPGRTAAERRRFVEFRLARQHVLRRPVGALHFDVVIGQAALRRDLGSPAVMREQLTALLDNVRNGLPNVRIRVAPIGLSMPAVLGGPFTLMEFATADEPDLAYFEGPGGSQYIQTVAVTTHHRHLFAALSDAVADTTESLALLEGALKDLA